MIDMFSSMLRLCVIFSSPSLLHLSICLDFIIYILICYRIEFRCFEVFNDSLNTHMNITVKLIKIIALCKKNKLCGLERCEY